MSELCV